MKNNDFYPEVIELFKNMETSATAVSPDNNILIQRLHQSELLSAYLMISSFLPAAQRGKSIVDLSTQIAGLFNHDELTSFYKELDEDLENLEGGGKSAKCLSLVEFMRRHGRLPDLISLLKKRRPKAVWPNADQITLPTIVKKDNLAVVVGMIHRRDGGNVFEDVANYLNGQGTDANILLFVTSGTISLKEDWNLFPKTFRDVINDTLSQTGTKVGHFFLAGVGGVLFSMGCMWGTIEKTIVYHKQDGTYNPIIQLPL